MCVKITRYFWSFLNTFNRSQIKCTFFVFSKLQWKMWILMIKPLLKEAKSYIYGLCWNLQLGERSLAVGLHFSYWAAVWLAAVRLRGSLGLSGLLTVHGPHIGSGFLNHRAGLNDRGRESLAGMLPAGERMHPWGRVPVGFPVPRRLAVTLLVVGRQWARVAARAHGALGRTGGGVGLVLGAVLAGLFASAAVVSLVALTATGATLAAAVPALHGRAFLRWGGCWGGRARWGRGRRCSGCQADGIPLAVLALGASALVAVLSRLLFRRTIRGFGNELGHWGFADSFLHFVVVSKHALDATCKFIFLGLLGERETGWERLEIC